MNYALKKPRAADDNRRAAGAVDLLASRCHYEQTKFSGDCRPGGKAFWLFRVFSGLMTNIRVLSCPFVVHK